MRNIILTSFAAVLLAGAITAAAAIDYVEGELIVEFADGVELDPPPGVPDGRYPELDALGLQYGVYESVTVFDLPTEQLDHPGGLWTWEDWQDMVEEQRLAYFFVLYYSSDDDPAVVAAAYESCSLVETAEPDYIGEFYFHPNDPHYLNGDQWYLYNAANRDCDINAPEGWDIFISTQNPPKRGKRGDEPYKPIVAVVDSGIWMSQPSYNYVHADIKANVIQGRDIYNHDIYPEDTFGHGTAIAGIAGAVWNNNYGIAGIGKNDTRIMPIGIADNSPYHRVKVKAACGGVIWAAEHFADVINMSWGFRYDYMTPGEKGALVSAVRGAMQLHISTVAAAGNTSGPNPAYPANEPNVRMITVAGTKKVPVEWARWEESSYWRFCVDISAPAYPDIYVTWLNNDYKDDAKGTSYSCAMVAATVAGYRHMLTKFQKPENYPWPGIDYHAQWCVEYSGPDYPDEYDQKTGFGTTYYDRGLERAIELQPDDGGGEPTLSAASPAITAAAAFPNPACRTSTLRVELGWSNVAEAHFAIYDLSGRKVRTFTAPVKEGSAEVVWDLADGAGAHVPPGVYIWRVEVGPASAAKKCVVN